MSDSGIFFKPWPTDYADDDLHILQVAYLNGGLDATKLLDDGRYGQYVVEADYHSEFKLAIKIFSYTKSETFQVLFEDLTAYRVLDEHGLCDLWSLERPNQAMFKVGGHAWTNESPISFAFGGDESWMVATDWDCVEVVSTNPPVIRKLGAVAHKFVDSADDEEDSALARDPVFDGAGLTKRVH